MLKYVWHIAVVLIIFCWTQEISARSTTSGTQQYKNGLTANTSDQQMHAATVTMDESSTSSMSGIWKDMSLVYRIYQQCMGANMSVCLKVKLLTGLEKVLRTAKTLKIIDGLQFVNIVGSSINENERSKLKLSISEKDIEAVLPRATDAKEQVLNSMIFKRLANFLQEHTLQIKFPDLRDDDQMSGNSLESRKKKEKKGNGAMIMIPLLLGGTFVPIAYGALAMLAGKALIVSKLALVLASIIGIKKLLSGGGGKESSHEVVVSSGSHSGWGRDMDLAYSSWKPGKDSIAGKSL